MSAEELYRYISFYDLYNLLECKLLRVSQATAFDDKNEGFGFVLRELDGWFIAAFGAPTGFDGPKTVKTLSYISCWTPDPNKIAMWLLYSKDFEGFRIHTTRTKLKSALTDYRKSYAASPKRIQDFSPKDDDNNIFDVAYEDFSEAKRGLKKRNDDMLLNLPITSSKAYRIRKFAETARQTMADLKFTENPWSYKDKAYDHEHEVRAVIEFKASSDEGDSLTGGRGDLSEFTSRFPNNIEVSISNDFLEDICIDERCPAFKKAVFKSFLSKYGYALSESRAFSSLFDDEVAI